MAAQDNHGMSPLTYAVVHGHTQCARLVLGMCSRAVINARDTSGYDPFHTLYCNLSSQCCSLQILSASDKLLYQT